MSLPWVRSLLPVVAALVLAADVDIESISKRTAGFSGADLAAVKSNIQRALPLRIA